MSNGLYDSARTLFVNGDISWTRSNVKVCFLNNLYVGAAAITSHTRYSDIAPYVLTGTVNVRSLTSKTLEPAGIKGAVLAANTQFTGITTGQVVAFIVIFVDTDPTVDGAPGSPTTAPLVAILDSGYGLGAGTNGGDILITWDTSLGILKI